MGQTLSKSGLSQRMQMRHAEKTMSKTISASKEQNQAHIATITEFINDKGNIICISDDTSFIDIINEEIIKKINIPAEKAHVASNADKILSIIRKMITNGNTPLLMLEQTLKNRDMTFILQQLKDGFPEMIIIAIAPSSANKDRLIHVHESGVDNIIIKPMPAQGIIEKISLAIKPQGNVVRQLQWAKNLLTQGEHIQALQVCQKALESKTNSANCLLLMGDIFKDMREYEKAQEAYENASKASSTFMEPLARLAELYADTNNIKKRLECLEKLDALSPMNVERKLLIGELYLKLKLPDRAKKVYDQAMTLSDKEAKEYMAGVAFIVADAYTEQYPDIAASFLERGLEAKKGYWSAEDIITFNRLGMLLRRTGKWEKAIEEYQKALTVAPNDETLHYNLAMAYLEGDNFEAARASALKALGINPDLPKKSSNVACNLGTVFIKTGDNMHALPLLRLALEIDPNNKQAKTMLENAGIN